MKQKVIQTYNHNLDKRFTSYLLIQCNKDIDVDTPSFETKSKGN